MLLNVHSYYSLRYGTMSPEAVVEHAKALGWDVLPLTDINTTMGVPEFFRICKGKGLQPLAGVDLREGDRQVAVLIARNESGLMSINRLLTARNWEKTDYVTGLKSLDETEIIYPFESAPGRKLLPNEWIGIRPKQLAKLTGTKLPYGREKLVALQTATFTGRWSYELHRNLRAIDHNVLLSRLKPGQFASKQDVWLSPEQMLKKYEYHPEILQNTSRLLQSCSLDIEFKRSSGNKKTFTGDETDDMELLRKLVMDGLDYRYGKEHQEAKRRIQKELQIIGEMKLAAYFLITWDIIRYSMSRGFYHVGRGSGANSIVAYCLRITDVDPIELDLYFERFINPRRSNSPDFDIDFSWNERDEVLDYIFRRYRHEHVALLGATSTFKERAILRELGKVYGLPKEEMDVLSRNPQALDRNDDIIKRILWFGNQMAGFPNMRTIHAGGVLITEEPVTKYTALDKPPKGYPVTQWDMYIAEDLGYDKFDILSQRGIGHIRDAAKIAEENRREKIDVHRVEEFKQDKKVKELLKRGRTMGAFYIESPAMRQLLSKLQCEDYKTLVAASSIIRPGVAKSGMMKEYIQRFHQPDNFQYLHPVMKEQLKGTYGVMVYQEDVLKVCHHYAGMDLGDADVLRRAMSGKYRSKKAFEEIRDMFFDGARKLGRDTKVTQEVWRQISSFAGYSFSKAHSASFAVESFQSLYLKAHYPLEFIVAVLNNFGGFYRAWVYVNEARQWGANIEAPCVNKGKQLTHIEGKTIYLGFVYVQNLEYKLVEKLLDERDTNGVYKSLDDFVERVQPSLEQLILLIRVRALRFIGKSKQELLWRAHYLLGSNINPEPTRRLFDIRPGNYKLPKLEHSALEDTYDELELLGFPVEMSMFDILKTSHRGDVMAMEMQKYHGKTIRMLGQLVTLKPVTTVKRELMNFGAFIDVRGDFFDTVHFPPSLKQYPFRGKGIYLLKGRVVEEFGHCSLEVEKMAKMPLKDDPRYG